ncbi:MAG: AraC family transcriptional regulator [Eubacteriales bacterium]|nr:AraC family transcriptional regulator [Eubacteriales bacterium]
MKNKNPEVLQEKEKKGKMAPQEVDESLKELGSHGSFELPVETYTDNCVIFRSLYNHWHKEMEIICIEKGCGLARLNKETIRLKKGDILMVNSGVIHGIRSDPKNILYYKSIVFDLSYLTGLPGDLCQEQCISLLSENRAEFTHVISPGDKRYPEIYRLFYQLHDCHREKKPYFYVELKSLFFRFLYEMLSGNYIIPVRAEQNKSLSSIKAVLDYIGEHYQETITVRELTELSNYSEYYFMKIFKEYTGKTVSAYLNDYRLEKAKSLLLHTDRSITEIALEVGFNNTSYFIKKFQQANQASPHKYRRNLS